MDEYFTLYDLVNKARMERWYDELAKKDRLGFGAKVSEDEETLIKSLNKEQLATAKSYALSVKNHSEDIFIQLLKRALDMGVKIGIELKDAFEKIDNNSY